MQPDQPMSKALNPILNLLASIRLTIFLMLLIAFGSIFGTFIPQTAGALHDARHLPAWVVYVSDCLMLYDVYHSHWFSGLAALLSLNILCCLGRRIPATRRSLRVSQLPRPAGHSVAFELTPEKHAVFRERFEALCRAKYRHVRTAPDSIFAENGRLTRLATYFMHLGIIVIIGGLTIGHIMGFRAHLSIPEGGLVSSMVLEGSSEVRDLGFKVRCDDFNIDFYANGMPREYKTTLSILRDDSAPETRELRVNFPIDLDGLRFYQADYAEAARAVLSVSSPEGLHQMDVIEGSVFPLGDATVHVLRVEKDLMEMGPAVELGIIAADERLRFWVFQNIKPIKKAMPDIFEKAPVFNPNQYEPYRFSLEQTDRVYFSGVMVSYDPGARISAAGAFMFLSGLFFMFFGSHNRIWGRSEKTPAGYRIHVNRHSSRQRPFHELERFLAEFEGGHEH